MIRPRRTIWQDPMTQTKPEGEALLLRRLFSCGFHNGIEYEQWQVRFCTTKGSQEPPCDRMIRKPQFSASEAAPCGQ